MATVREKKSEKLKMSFDPLTIEHLGIKMYSSLPTAIAELIANSYDADATNVKISLVDKNSEKEIIVQDDGVGMSFKEVNDFFLRIGRNRRKEGFTNSPSGQRKATGKKGLGKLAFFGIGDEIEVVTIRKNSGKKIQFVLKWKDLINSKTQEYEPVFSISNCSKSICGTSIRLLKLKRKSNFCY